MWLFIKNVDRLFSGSLKEKKPKHETLQLDALFKHNPAALQHRVHDSVPQITPQAGVTASVVAQRQRPTA